MRGMRPHAKAGDRRQRHRGDGKGIGRRLGKHDEVVGPGDRDPRRDEFAAGVPAVAHDAGDLHLRIDEAVGPSGEEPLRRLHEQVAGVGFDDKEPPFPLARAAFAHVLHDAPQGYAAAVVEAAEEPPHVGG